MDSSQRDWRDQNMAKSDARARYTEEMIRKEFLRLLQEKPLSKITVSEICKGAGINRATFYKHYLDVYDLLDHIEQDLIQEFHERFSRKRLGTLHNMKEGIAETLRILKSDSETYFALFGKNGDPSFHARIIKSFLPYFTPELAGESNTEAQENMRKMYYSYISAGSTGVISCWIAGNMEMPEEEVAEIITSLANTSARMWKEKRENLRNS